jgi:outer membrane immunogenic protein
MKKICIWLAALFALMTAPAFAADIAVKAPPMAATWSWSGFYAGLNGGYSWNQKTGDGTCVTPGGVVNGVGCWAPNSGLTTPKGGLVGGQIGYNWQAGSLVYGLETDFQWSDTDRPGTLPNNCCNPTFTTVIGAPETASASLKWFGTVRARAGFLVTPNALVYGTGGLIYGQEVLSGQIIYPLVSYQATATTLRPGVTAGGGVEYAFTQNLTGKLEGLWYDMGSASAVFTSPATAYFDSYRYRFTGGMVRAGLNWRFGPWFSH